MFHFDVATHGEPRKAAVVKNMPEHATITLRSYYCLLIAAGFLHRNRINHTNNNKTSISSVLVIQPASKFGFGLSTLLPFQFRSGKKLVQNLVCVCDDAVSGLFIPASLMRSGE